MEMTVEQLTPVEFATERVWNGEYYTNQSGLKWCKKCVSCRHCAQYEDSTKRTENLRRCSKHSSVVEKTCTCDDWEFGAGSGDGSVGLGREQAGRRLGRVKTMGFMRYRIGMRNELENFKRVHNGDVVAISAASANFQTRMDNSEYDYPGKAYFKF